MLESERKYRKKILAGKAKSSVAVLTYADVARIMTERGMPMSLQRVYELECSAMVKLRKALAGYR